MADGWLRRLPASLDELDGLLLTVATPRKVHRVDGIHFQGLRYLATSLAAFVGESVIIRYDPRDITEIRVFHKNRFLCTAIDPDLAGDMISLKDIQAARAAQRRAVRGHINDRIATVAAYLPELTAPPDGRPADEPTRPRRRLATTETRSVSS